MLEKINKINDIKKLTKKEKILLAHEIREYIIDVISKNGGHLASNLGVVELTMALHSVFDLNKDKIVWDVGHQCYVHKILSGRKDDFKSIRKYKGLSGFPKTSESLTDVFNTGHSSTSLSAAMGLAKARDLKCEKHNVIAVIGDGALTGGMALEALNHIGCTNTKIIVILNDNEMSISKNISGMNKMLTRLRSRRRYVKSNEYGKLIISKIPILGKPIIKVVQKSKDIIKQAILPAMYFEEIGFKYLGPVDGHKIDDLECTLNKAKELDGPILIHVKTIKGNGYNPALINPEKFHGVNPFDKDTGLPLNNKKDDYSKVFGDELCNLAKKNKKIVAITAAMKDGVGLTKFASKYNDRFFDVGIAEEHAITFGAGLAASGMIPVIPIYSSFYQRAYDQIIHDVCAQNLHVIFCIDRAGIVGSDGETHQGLFDMAFLRLIPNITILAPSDFSELKCMLRYAIDMEGPVVIRYPRGSEEIDFGYKEIKNKKAQVLSIGSDVTIVAIGKYVSRAMHIKDELLKEKIQCEVINARFLKPIDEKTILNSIDKTKYVITLEDGTTINGLGTAINELIVKRQLKDIKCINMGYNDTFVTHGSVDELEKQYKLDIKSIVNKIKKGM